MYSQCFKKQRLSKCCKLIFALSAVLLTVAGIPAYGSEWVFSASTPSGHRGPITAIVHKGNTILSAGEDGFLEVWDTGARSQALERFQVSPYRIAAMAERPGKDEVCLLETDGMGLYRISAWNYKERKSIFSLQLRDQIGSVFYSTGGSFIIAARTGRAGLIFIDPNSGDTLQSPQSLTGTVGLAATGKSDRNMVVYVASGRLSYWELGSGRETNHFDVPANLASPVLFGNSRYLAGVNAEGLTVINAVSGEVMAKDTAVPAGSLLCSSGDECICLVQKAGTSAEISRYTIDRSGRLVKAGIPLTVSAGENKRFTTIAANGEANGNDNGNGNGKGKNNNKGNANGAKGTIALGTNDGSLVLASMNGSSRTLSVKEQIYITEAEVSGSTIAFLTANGTMGFIPGNYNQLTARKIINVEQNQENYTHITAFTGSDEQFVLWQDKNTRTLPIIRSFGPDGKKTPLNGITFRSPIRAADSFGGKILFLDSMGNLSVVSPLDGKKAFTFFSVGLMDAAFLDQNRLIVGRSAVAGNAPFVNINLNTGETVPLPYSAQAGVIMHRGASGNIFAAAVSSNEEDETRTLILRLDLVNISSSVRLVDFPGEETQFSLAESPSGVVANIGGEEAAIHSTGGVQKLDRTGGLPFKLMNSGSALISLDRDGSICWYDNRSGKILAIFRLHPDSWTLQTERGTISGGVSR